MLTTANIAEAVKDVLNDGDFSQPFTAVRSPLPKVDLEDQALHVLVAAQDYSAQMMSRSDLQYDHLVDVGVMKSLESISNTTVDPMQALLQEIVAKFLGKGLSVGDVGVVCIRADVKSLGYPDHLKSDSQYFGLLTFTFRLLEGIA